MTVSASSKLIIRPLFPRLDLTSTTPKRAAAAAARTSQLSQRAYPECAKGGEWDGLVHWSNRGDGGPHRGAAQGARQAAGPRGSRGPREPGRANPDRRDSDGRKLSRRS